MSVVRVHQRAFLSDNKLLIDMKDLFEHWKAFLLESVLGDYENQLEFSDDGEVMIYHVSSKKGLKSLDPSVAAANLKGYTRREYGTWERPRVFFFTRRAQEDTGIGRIQGSAYVGKIEPDKLYPLYKDPNGYKASDKKEEYKIARKEESGMAEYYPVNIWDQIWYHANKDGFKGFIYPQGGAAGNLIVAMWDLVDVEPIEGSFYQ